MSDAERKPTGEQPLRGGAAGPRAKARKWFQIAVLIGVLIVVFGPPPEFDRRAFLFGTMIVVVLVDLVMLWRGDLTYTHFGSRKWSFRMNWILLALAVGFFAYALTDSF